MKKQLLVYDKNNIEEFKNSILNTYGRLYPISYLTNFNLSLKYTSIGDEDKIVIDITAMVLSVKARPDLQIMYEGWVNALNEENKENVYFCVENTCIKDACYIFHHYFSEPEGYEDNVVTEEVNEIKENTKMEDKEEKEALSL